MVESWGTEGDIEGNIEGNVEGNIEGRQMQGDSVWDREGQGQW